MTYPPQPSGPPQSTIPQGGYVVPPRQYAPAYQPMPVYQGPPPPMAPGGRRLAEFSDRLLAFLIDTAVFFGLGLVLAVPAVIGIVLVVSNEMDKVQYDQYGYATTEPDFWAIFLPIIGIYGGVFLVSLVFTYLYEVELVLRKDGQNWGKKAMKIKIAPLDDPTAQLTRGMLVKRWLVHRVMAVFVPFFSWIDGLWQLWDQPYKQCLHDKWSGTVVVKAQP